MVHSQREFTSGEHKGQTSSQWRFYLSSRNDIGAAEFNQNPQHWTIENDCRWVLDMNFREDDCRIRVGHGAPDFRHPQADDAKYLAWKYTPHQKRRNRPKMR